MNIQIFTFCEFAQSTNGKTNIIGTYNSINPQSFPFIMPDIFLVIKLAFLEDVNEKISLSLREKGGADIINTGEQTLTVKCIKNREAIHDIVLRINQVPFQKPGEYEAVFKIGGKEFTTTLYVNEVK